MREKKAKTDKATQPTNQPLYKGTIKVTPSTDRYVPIDKYIKALEERNALQDEVCSLKQNELNSNQRKVFFYDIADYYPFATKFNLALN